MPNKDPTESDSSAGALPDKLQILISEYRDNHEIFFWRDFGVAEDDPRLYIAPKLGELALLPELEPITAKFFKVCSELNGLHYILLDRIGTSIGYSKSPDPIEDALKLSSSLYPRSRNDQIEIEVKTFQNMPEDIFQRFMATREQILNREQKQILKRKDIDMTLRNRD